MRRELERSSEAPYFSQSLNRYSYTFNNPLSYTDPSGFSATAPDARPAGFDVDDVGDFLGDIYSGYFSWEKAYDGNGACAFDLSTEKAWRACIGLSWPMKAIEEAEPGAKTSNAADPPVSTVVGRGTWGDFFGGMLRGVVDDWQRMGALYGYSRMIEAGQWKTAGQLLASANTPLLGPIDTPRGQFGYDLAPASQIVVGGGLRGLARRGTTMLFRAVGPAELADIQATGALRSIAGLEGKYFTTSAEAASSYAKQAVKGFGDPPYTLIGVRVPNSIFDGLTPATVDRGIPAWVIPNERLRGLTPEVLNVMPIPGL